MHNKIVILTGAGISAESGLGTFRDENGLWSQHCIEDVATPEAFKKNPQLVHQFYNDRRKQARESLPNSGHHALARLQAKYAGEVVIVTQNIDSLHEKSGATVIHMHGELDNALCSSCDFRWKVQVEMFPEELCPNCASPTCRPDIVWFGEIPYKMDLISRHLLEASLFAAIGTSGEVYPAAGFVQDAKLAGAHTVEINLEPSSIVSNFAEARFGPATKIVPTWVNEILSQKSS